MITEIDIVGNDKFRTASSQRCCEDKLCVTFEYQDNHQTQSQFNWSATYICKFFKGFLNDDWRTKGFIFERWDKETFKIECGMPNSMRFIRDDN